MDQVVRFSSRGARRHLDSRRALVPEPDGPWWASVIVCRSCCCGTTRKHPYIDHDRQLALLRWAAYDAGSVLRVSGCQGICQFSNLVVLRHRRHRITIGQVLSDEATDAVTPGSAIPTWYQTRRPEWS